MCAQPSVTEASVPSTALQGCIYFGLTSGFFFNLLWRDRLSLKLKLLYVTGLLFLGWFFFFFSANRILFVHISLETKKVAASLLAGVLPLCASTAACGVTVGEDWVGTGFFRGWLIFPVKLRIEERKAELCSPSCRLPVPISEAIKTLSLDRPLGRWE